MYPGFITAPGTAKLSEPYNTYSNRRYPLGTLLITQDGRKFRFCENGAVALSAGVVVQSPVPGANFDELAIPAAVAAGARAFSITNGATAITADQFAGGYLNVEDDAGEGHLYLIEGNAAEAAGSAAFEIRLASGIETALTTASTVGLTQHPFADVIIHPSPATARLVGAAPHAVAANEFFWAQVGGPASVLTEGTLVINEKAFDSATADGAAAPGVLTEGTPNTGLGQHEVGIVMEVAATTEHSLLFLTLE